MPASEAPTILKDDVLEMTIRGQLCGQVTLTVLHWKANFESAPMMNNALDAIDTQVRTVGDLRDKYIDAACNNFQLVELVLQMIHPTRYARLVYPFTETGLMAQDALTADLAGVIVKRGWFATDRSLALSLGKVGMVHYPAIPKDKIEEGILDNDYRANKLAPLGEKVTQPMLPADGNEWLPVLFNRNAAAPTTSEVTSYTVKPEARVMRRRTVGFGI